MEVSGVLTKMRVADGDPISYELHLGDARVAMNDLLGAALTVTFSGLRVCRVCGTRVDELFGEGFCRRDFESSPLNAPCIVRPELCEAHLGRGRDPAWEEAHHHRAHVVYLADSGGVKVGVTGDNPLTRWIDQGAAAAVRIAEVPYRRIAGEIEVALKATFSDRTAWQRMLTSTGFDRDALLRARSCAVELIPEALRVYALADDPVVLMRFPMRATPAKVRSVDLGRQPEARGRLIGIRGQYLLFEGGAVLNVRRHTGFDVTLRA